MKDASGLSLAALSERSPYSKSAWERYLNGKKLPPLDAVTALGRLAGDDAACLRALWELAEEAWNRPRPPDRSTAPESKSDAGPPTDTVEADVRPVRRNRPIAHLAAAFVIATAVAGGVTAWTMTGGHEEDGSPRTSAATSSAPTGGADADLNTRCYADSCTGLDPKDTGCAGDAWTSALTRVNQVYVELRYSDACQAAWARISWGRPGDTAEAVPWRGTPQKAHVHYDTDVYTAMVAASDPSKVKACTVLRHGRHGCTGQGGTRRLLEPPEPPVSPSPSPRS